MYPVLTALRTYPGEKEKIVKVPKWIQIHVDTSHSVTDQKSDHRKLWF